MKSCKLKNGYTVPQSAVTIFITTIGSFAKSGDMNKSLAIYELGKKAYDPNRAI